MRSSRTAVGLVAVCCLPSLWLAGCGKDASSPQTGRVEGRVVLDLADEPLAGARVVCAGQQRVTGADGWFTFEAVPQGEQLLQAELATYRPWSSSIKVTSSVNLTVAMVPVDTTGDLSGRVYNVWDGNVGQARVSCAGLAVITQLDGGFLLKDLPLGRWAVVVDHPAYDTLRTVILVARPAQQRDLRLLRTLEVEVPVTRDADVRTSVEERERNFGEASRLTVSISTQSMAVIGLPDLAPPADRLLIESASLRLWIYPEDPRDGASITCFQAFRVIAPWTEATISGVNPPVLDETAPAIDYSSPDCYGHLPNDWSELDLDVTAAMLDVQAGGPNDGLLLRHLAGKAVPGSFVIVASEEPTLAQLRPAVVIRGRL